MRKITIAFLSIFLTFNMSYAGGLVTNTNQSTAWARLLVRDASTDIDAVYYNPAGLTKLKDGFHLSISNQSIFQKQYVTNTFQFLNDGDYVGTVSAPIFPSFYAAYKTGKFAFSIGFNPIGGGGSAEFAKGLPSIEVPISSLKGSLSSLGVTGYSADLYFKGSSIYWGLQAGISYEINDNISLYLGARYVMAKNTYQGHVKDITLTLADGTTSRADDFMKATGDQADVGAQAATEAATNMQPLIDGGAGQLTFDQAVAMGIINSTQSQQMQEGLIQLGYPADVVANMNLETAQSSYSSSAVYLTGVAQQMHAGAPLMADQEADVTQTGSGYAPIIGANFTFFDNTVNIGMKYEFKTKMDLTNSTPKGKGFVIGYNDDGTQKEMFPDGQVTNADMPAMFSIGTQIVMSPKVTFHAGFHNYFDKNTGWKDVDKTIASNSYEAAVGIEYNVSDKFLLSGGYLYATSGVNKAYQSDFSFSLPTNTLGFGGAYKFNDTFKLQFGGYYVTYNKSQISGSADVGGTAVPYVEKYHKQTWALSIGLDIAILSKK